MNAPTTRSTVFAALDELREVNFAAYCQLTSGNWIMASAMDDANADYWRSDDAAALLADIRNAIDCAKAGAR